MTAQLSPAPVFRSWDNLGFPLVGGKLFTYAAGTTTPQATYVDSTQTTPNTNPVTLNFRGEAFVWLDPTLIYKFVLQDFFGNLLWTEDNIPGGFGANGFSISLIPNPTNTYSLGNSTHSWTNVYLGPNAAPAFDPVSGNIGYYARTAAEIAAGVTPVNCAYPSPDIRRYGGDPTGSANSAPALNNLIAVMLQLGGAATTIWPGTYKLTTTITYNLAPTTGPTAVTYGLKFFAEGVTFNYTGTGYAFDFFATNTSALFAFPILVFYGAQLVGTGSAIGGFRLRTLSAVHWHEVEVQGFTAGPAWTMLNDVAWSENCHFRGCGAVNCQNIIAFQRTAGTNSFSRTYVDGMFGAGITGPWFDVGGTIPSVGVSNSCSVYDSRWTHIGGNFGSTALFAIGNSTNASDMTSTVIDGLDYEINAVVTNQCIMLLRDYPQNSGVARRPILVNIGAYAIFNGSGNTPVWMSGAFATLAGPETVQTQALNTGSPLQSNWGQSLLYEPSFGIAAQANAATYDSVLQGSITVTGFASAPSGRVLFSRSGNQASLKVFDPLTGTSNSTGLTLTTLPAEYRPATQCYVSCTVEDNGNTNVPAIATIATSGVITFSIYTSFNTPNVAGFTATGTKGLPSGNSFTWPLT